MFSCQVITVQVYSLLTSSVSEVIPTSAINVEFKNLFSAKMVTDYSAYVIL